MCRNEFGPAIATLFWLGSFGLHGNLSCPPVKVTESHRQRVRSVKEFWSRFEAQQVLDHRLYLLFRRSAVTYHGFLHLAGRILCCWNLVIHGREDCNSACVPDLQGRLCILAVKRGFDCEFIGMI